MQIRCHGIELVRVLHRFDNFWLIESHVLLQLRRVNGHESYRSTIRASILGPIAQGQQRIDDADRACKHVGNGQRRQNANTLLEAVGLSTDKRAARSRVDNLLEPGSLSVVAIWAVAIEVDIDDTLTSLGGHLGDALGSKPFALERAPAENL